MTIGTPDGRQPLVFCWGVSSFFGWGVFGLNLLLSLANHPRFVPLCAMKLPQDQIVVDPVRNLWIGQSAKAAQPLWQALEQAAAGDIELNHPLLLAIGRDLEFSTAENDRPIFGRPTLGVAFLEEAGLSAEGRARADRFAMILAGSSWNERILRAQGIDRVATVIQGVDTALYHPAPRAGLFPGRFVVFSGGKLELRKGQDLVLAAFRAFRQRHREALLLTAWHSPWSDLMAEAVARSDIVLPQAGPDGMPDIAGWAVANGIPADAIVPIGRTPNIAMPHVIREADVALFPNRCEGGTNLVAMECLASGVPCILSANTGHLDLLRDPIALKLQHQAKVHSTAYDTQDWGESDVEEMVEALETVWRDRGAAAVMAERAVQRMAAMTWQAQMQHLLDTIEPVLNRG